MKKKKTSQKHILPQKVLKYTLVDQHWLWRVGLLLLGLGILLLLVDLRQDLELHVWVVRPQLVVAVKVDHVSAVAAHAPLGGAAQGLLLKIINLLFKKYGKCQVLLSKKLNKNLSFCAPGLPLPLRRWTLLPRPRCPCIGSIALNSDFIFLKNILSPCRVYWRIRSVD